MEQEVNTWMQVVAFADDCYGVHNWIWLKLKLAAC